MKSSCSKKDRSTYWNLLRIEILKKLLDVRRRKRKIVLSSWWSRFRCWFVCPFQIRVERIIESHSTRKALRNICWNNRIHWIILSMQSWSWQCNLLLPLARTYFWKYFCFLVCMCWIMTFLSCYFIFWIEKSQRACWKWQNENEGIDIASLSYVRRSLIGFVACSLQASDPLFVVHKRCQCRIWVIWSAWILIFHEGRYWQS